ncbi:hypothetical protein CRG98_035352 [Punica granatum]|uniref:Uncharacterized protein n=1 Tax=Punica granatum TaxID=22663 RepID=A0A2I0IJT3_PUNGR|nr:hypothetical protein CRG98_035352 [Punica granatum]
MQLVLMLGVQLNPIIEKLCQEHTQLDLPGSLTLGSSLDQDKKHHHQHQLFGLLKPFPAVSIASRASLELPELLVVVGSVLKVLEVRVPSMSSSYDRFYCLRFPKLPSNSFLACSCCSYLILSSPQLHRVQLLPPQLCHKPKRGLGELSSPRNRA